MAGDAHYASVATLLHFDGPNGSGTFADNAPSPSTYTAGGGAVLSTAQSVFGGASLLVNGSQYIDTPADEKFQLGSGNFTIETRIRPNAIAATNMKVCGIWFDTGGAGLSWKFQLHSSGRLLFSYSTTGGNTINVLTPSNALVANTWYAICVMRSGNNIYFFIDGVMTHSQAFTDTIFTTANTKRFEVGRDAAGNTEYINAYFDEMRVTRGVARYSTSGYTVDTAALHDGMGQVSGTVLDASGAAAARMVRALRRRDGALVKEIYTNAADASYPNVSLLLHFDGTNGSTSIVDKSPAPKTATVNGNAQLSTAQSVFGGSSLLLDGNGDFLSFADHADFELGAGDFFIEARVRLTAFGTNNAGFFRADIVSKDLNGSRGFSFEIGGTSTAWNSLEFNGFSSNTTGASATASFAFSLNTWYTVAVGRTGNLVYLFVDGVLLNPGGTAFNITIQNTTGALNIGSINYDATFKYYFPGYIDEVRLTKGVGRRTAGYTPDTDRFPERASGAIGAYSFYAPTLDELTVLALDNADSGTIYNDVCERVIPA